MTLAGTTEVGEPTASMHLDDHGAGEVVVAGEARSIAAATVDQAREKGLAEVRRLAQASGSAVTFTTDEPAGRWTLVMHPDGRIVDPADTPTRPAPSRSTPDAPSPAAVRPASVAPAREPQAPPPEPAPAPAPAAPAASYDSTYVLNSIVPVTRVARSTRGLRGLLGIGPGAKELAERSDRRDASQAYGRPVTVVVADPRGGSGKTTTSLLLAGAFGIARGGGVLTLENHELRGTMHLRADAAGSSATIRDLLRVQAERATPQTIRLGDLSGFVRHQVAGQYDVLVSATKSDRALARVEFEAVHELVSRFYQLTIVDTANNESAENWRAAIEKADALVVPVKWRNDYSMPAIEMLEELQNSGNPHHQSLVRRAVVVASHNQGDLDPRCRQHLMPYFADRTQAVIEIAPDRHIAEGNVIQHDQLGAATRRAADRAAAEVAKAIRAGLSG